jgi:hypothetical protein
MNSVLTSNSYIVPILSSANLNHPHGCSGDSYSGISDAGTTSMTMATLPPELTDRIIDFLHFDYEALKACSLVCKNWIPSSRYNLFGNLDLTSSIDQHSLIRLLKNSPASTIPNHVHTFSIYIPDPRHDLFPFFDRIAPYLDRFPVRSLTLTGHQWKPISKEHEGYVSKWFSGIRELHVHLNFSSPEDFCTLITCFCSLETLRIRLERLRFGVDDLQPKIHSFAFPPHLRTLKIRLDHARPLLSWLVSVTQFPPINILELSTITDKELPAVRALLQTLGPSIHSLMLQFACSIRAFIQLLISESMFKIDM